MRINKTIWGFFIILLAGSACGQVISPEVYRTEEDLLEGLRLGELTYDQYLELYDLLQEKPTVDQADSSLLSEIPDATPYDASQKDYDSQQRLFPFISAGDSSNQDWQGRVVVQHKQMIDQESEPQTYLRMQAGQESSWSFYLESEGRPEENRIKRRGMEFHHSGKWRIALGNFQPNFGLGVNVGRRTYLNLSSDSSLSAKNTLLFPYLSRYNGILGTYTIGKTSSDFLYSQNRFGGFKEEALAGEVSFSYKKITIAPILSYLEISQSGEKFFSRAGSLFAQWKEKSFYVQAEGVKGFPEGEGIVVLSRYANKQSYKLDISFWSYAQDFIGPISGGRAMPDYTPLRLGELDLSLRSRQAGETGAEFAGWFAPSPRTSVELAYQGWSDGETLLNKNKARLGAGYWLSPKLETRVRQYWEDDDLNSGFPEERTTSLSVTYLFSSETRLGVRANYQEKDLASENKKGLWQEVYLSLPFKEILRSKVRVRYRDPDLSAAQTSTWDFYVSETLQISRKGALWVEFVSKHYQDDSLEDVESVKARLEWTI